MTGILKVDQWKDSGDNALISSDGSGALTFNASSITGVATTNGITEADQWRVTTSFSGDQTPVASNWERNDTDFSLIGTGMTQSSGVFTFPSTGIYLVEYSGVISDTVQNRWTDFLIQFTTNNGGNWYLRGSQGTAGMTAGTDSMYTSAKSSCILDVTDISTHKVRFSIDFNSGSAVAQASSSYQYHGATFIRLGDT